MFILVNCSDDFGLNEVGRFATEKEAFEYIANEVYDNFDYQIDMSEYPFDNDPIGCCHSGKDLSVIWGNDFCNCTYYNEYGAYNEKWLIVKA